MDTLWDTMWSTLWGTLWRPRNPRGYPQNPWILERDSRETQERLKRDSRETVSTTPKAWIPKSEKSEMRTDTTHSSSKSSSNKRKSDTKGEGGKWARAWGWSERGRPFSPTHECVECDPLGSIGNHWEPLGVEGHLREVSCHVTCPNAWNQVSNHEDMTWHHTTTHHHTSPERPCGAIHPYYSNYYNPLWTALTSCQQLKQSCQQLSGTVRKGPDRPWRGSLHRGMTTPLSFPFLSLLSPWKAGLTPSLLPSCFMEGDCLVEACVLASTREQWSVAGVAMVFGWKADGMLTLTGGTYPHWSEGGGWKGHLHACVCLLSDLSSPFSGASCGRLEGEERENKHLSIL